MSWIFLFCIGFSIIYAIITGRIDFIQEAIFSVPHQMVEFVCLIAGSILFWNGILKMMENAHFLKIFTFLFERPMSKIFPEIDPNTSVFVSMIGNLCSSLLGFGMVSTSLGLITMKELCIQYDQKKISRKVIDRFILLNAIGPSLLPIGLFQYREIFHAKIQFELLPILYGIQTILVILVLLFTKSRKVKTT